MPSTPSKTNCQANYFGSKVVPTEFNYNSEKKAPIWQKKKTVCKICKVPLFLHIFEHSASVSVFGLRPDIRFQPKVKNIPSVIHCHHLLDPTSPLSSLLSGTRHSPAIHVHGDYDHDKGIERIKNILGDEKSSQWFKDGEHKNHVGIVNVWRPLDYPVEKCPLGHVDIDTIR